MQATWENVQDEMLSGTWHVLHFIGHGDYDERTDQGVIALVGEVGGTHLVEADRLAGLLNEAQPTPALVVLNSCQSGRSGAQDLFSSTAATLVRGGISAVAAMQFSISDAGATKFARGLYSALASGRSLGDAIGSGRVGLLSTPGSLEWVTPVLYVRSDVSRLFTIAPAAPLLLRPLLVHRSSAARSERVPTEGCWPSSVRSLSRSWRVASVSSFSSIRRIRPHPSRNRARLPPCRPARRRFRAQCRRPGRTRPDACGGGYRYDVARWRRQTR